MDRLDEMTELMDKHINSLKNQGDYNASIEENLIFTRKLFDMESRIIRYYATYHLRSMRDLKMMINFLGRILNINGKHLTPDDKIRLLEKVLIELRIV